MAGFCGWGSLFIHGNSQEVTSSSLLNKHLWEVISLHKALFLAKSTSNLLLRLAQLVGIKLFVRKVTIKL